MSLQRKNAKKLKPNSIVDMLSSLCKECQLCCNEVSIQTAYRPRDKDILNFYKIRGFGIEIIDGVVWFTMSFPCPKLTKSGCSIYTKRPKVCKEYSGIDGQFGCKFDEIAKRIQA